MYKSLEHKVDSSIVAFFLIVASIVSLCLWIAELRNRELYRGLIDKGKLLEDSENQAYRILCDLSKVRKKWRPITQSISLDILAYICFITLINSAIILFNKPNLLDFHINQISCVSKYVILAIDIIFFTLIDPLGMKYIYLNRKEKKVKLNKTVANNKWYSKCEF